MTTATDPSAEVAIAQALVPELERASSGAKRMKVRSLLKRFGYVKRSDRNTVTITAALDAAGIALSPAIVRLGDEWELDYEDWVYLSLAKRETATKPTPAAGSVAPPPEVVADPWFDRIVALQLRSEREVETKFILPLLQRLGFTEDDRFDGMHVEAAIGSRPTQLTVDFALFDHATEALNSQALLVVEAKREALLTKSPEIARARNQARSYALWMRCDFYMITNGRLLQLHDLKHLGPESAPLFSCERGELRERFAELYGRASKQALRGHYLKKQQTTEEITA
jgi:hypothetical protein